MVEINNLFMQSEGIDVLKDISLSVNEGELFGIIGRASSGKSLLCSGLSGLWGYDGSIKINGRELREIPVKEKNRLLSAIERRYAINPELTVSDFTLLSRVPNKQSFRSFSQEDREINDNYLRELSLYSQSLLTVGSLSESGLSLAMIAFSMVREAPLLILDEPTAYLDPEGSIVFSKALIKYLFNGGRTAVICSNDLNFLFQNADRIAIIHDGRIAEVLSPSEINAELLLKYFGIDTIITRNVYNGKPVVNIFSEK
jgi:iron complex transport system ATP-binding protein